MGLKDFLFGRGLPKQSMALAEFYNGDLARWNDIYNGGGDWRYTRKGGINGGTRRVAALNAARAVCGELSRLCFADGSQLKSSDSETDAFLSQVLEDNRFTERFPDFLEKVFALGGGVIKVYWDDGIKLDFVTADCFVPTGWDGRRITGAAFGSQIFHEGRSYILAEKQELTAEGYVTENRLMKADGGRADVTEVFPNLMERSVITGLAKPLFVYFGTGKSAVPQCRSLGASVFAGAEDTLKSIDLVFDSLNREFVLGKKRIIVPYYAVRGEYDENGDIKQYFDVNDEVFQALSTTDNEELKISDNTAQLRVEEHLQALSGLLDLLCMQVGLSEGALSYKDGTVKTATEVVSRNSRTYRTQCFYRGLISQGLSDVVQSICSLGKMSGMLSSTASEDASLMFADGVCEDEGTRLDRVLKLHGAGLISKERALAQIYGITLEQAQAMSLETLRKED